jgi:hypothetical protein
MNTRRGYLMRKERRRREKDIDNIKGKFDSMIESNLNQIKTLVSICSNCVISFKIDDKKLPHERRKFIFDLLISLTSNNYKMQQYIKHVYNDHYDISSFDKSIEDTTKKEVIATHLTLIWESYPENFNAKSNFPILTIDNNFFKHIKCFIFHLHNKTEGLIHILNYCSFTTEENLIKYFNDYFTRLKLRYMTSNSKIKNIIVDIEPICETFYFFVYFLNFIIHIDYLTLNLTKEDRCDIIDKFMDIDKKGTDCIDLEKLKSFVNDPRIYQPINNEGDIKAIRLRFLNNYL